jgi:hypothetical protein
MERDANLHGEVKRHELDNRTQTRHRCNTEIKKITKKTQHHHLDNHKQIRLQQHRKNNHKKKLRLCSRYESTTRLRTGMCRQRAAETPLQRAEILHRGLQQTRGKKSVTVMCLCKTKDENRWEKPHVKVM